MPLPLYQFEGQLLVAAFILLARRAHRKIPKLQFIPSAKNLRHRRLEFPTQSPFSRNLHQPSLVLLFGIMKNQRPRCVLSASRPSKLSVPLRPVTLVTGKWEC